MTAGACREKCEIYLLMNMHNAQAESNFHDDHGNAVKHVLWRTIISIRVDKSDRMANTYTIGSNPGH